jgi:hypothetical protein
LRVGPRAPTQHGDDAHRNGDASGLNDDHGFSSVWFSYCLASGTGAGLASGDGGIGTSSHATKKGDI